MIEVCVLTLFGAQRYCLDYSLFVFVGPGCVRVLKDLVQLKEDYPERVHLILGNRDINKLRIQFSMHPTVLKTLPAVKWLKLPPEETVGPDYKLNDPESKMKWVSLQLTFVSLPTDIVDRAKC